MHSVPEELTTLAVTETNKRMGGSSASLPTNPIVQALVVS
jgi:hypothetical protein